MKSFPQQHPIRILALGDSYTIGTGVVEEERWPEQLARSLMKNGFPVSIITYIAQNGWTTSDLLAAISKRNHRLKFELVSLLIGVNNQYQGLDISEYLLDFKQLLKSAANYTNGDPGRVLVLSIPDWSVTPFAYGLEHDRISAEIDAFNVVNQRLSIEAGAHYVDITPLTRSQGTKAANYAEDGLHPSGVMYAAWVELVLEVILRTITIQPDK